MKIDTSAVNKAISEAIKAVGNGYMYEDLRLSTVNLISVASYLVGCIEAMQSDADDEKSNKPTKSYEEWIELTRQFYEKEWNKNDE